MSLRDYIGSENFKYDLEDTPKYQVRAGTGSYSHKFPDGNSIF